MKSTRDKKKMNVKLSFQIRTDAGFVERIDEWRSTQRPIPSRAEAIRLLIARGLGFKPAGKAK